MMVLGPIAFAAPWIIGAVLVLPALWWLLRLSPPRPLIVPFPAIRLLRDLIVHEETPARTPLWLLALRLTAALMVIASLAGPVLHPPLALPGTGPLVLVIDDGWSAAPAWSKHRQHALDLLAQAEQQGRDVVVVTTAPIATHDKMEHGQAAGPMRAADAKRLVLTLEPHPWPSDRAAALTALRALPALTGLIHPLWLSDGIDDAGVIPLASYLMRLGGTVTVAAESPPDLPNLILPPLIDSVALTARLVRATADPARILPARTLNIRADSGNGRLLAIEPAIFTAGTTTAEVRFELPLDLRNQVERIGIEGEATAGATVLLDERWLRRPVGLISGRNGFEAQPLLDDLYYLERALEPTCELRRGSIAELTSGNNSVLILTDTGALDNDEIKMLQVWVKDGGLLLRFAGPRLAHAPDTMLPVRLRRGDRALGGALSWDKPATLAPFDAASPFAGLTAPPDVTVARQVLAEPALDAPVLDTPALDTSNQTWARLADGTPLVTASKRGRGTIVLVHTTANPEWSNLALSGLFVDMLRRLVALASGVQGGSQNGVSSASLPPISVLDGLGRLGEPAATVLPIATNDLAAAKPGPQHPPGFYGTADSRRALNLTAAVTGIRPMKTPAGVTRTGYARTGEIYLQPPLLLAALCLLVIDMVIALALRGLLTMPRPTLVLGRYGVVYKNGSGARPTEPRRGNPTARE
ncbi:MAG: BatA domain-containing protein [Rhodospirillaceae bacterium]